jgi:hypothetical protein
MSNAIVSLTPGFSPVRLAGKHKNRFNGFPSVRKPLKRLGSLLAYCSRLKPGVNETGEMLTHFCGHP